MPVSDPTLTEQYQARMTTEAIYSAELIYGVSLYTDTGSFVDKASANGC